VRHAAIGPFVVEHVCRERALIVELQRSETVAAERLRARLQFFGTLGFRVVLVKSADVLKRPQEVLSQVREALK
jgi:very-short-patch-repair endonuclease